MYNAGYLLARLVGVIEFLFVLFIGLRIVLKLIGANSLVPIVSFIYSISDSMISPFRGILADGRLGNLLIDWSAIVALIAYVIIFSIIISVINSLIHPQEDTHSHAHV